MTTKKQPKKHVIAVTYIIALICLILGLVLPFYKDASGDNKMLILMLPSVISNVTGIDFGSVGTTFPDADVISIFGAFELDVNSLAILTYACATVIGIILLIPVLACKKKRTAIVCSAIAEDIALIALFVYTFNNVALYSALCTTPSSFAESFPFNWSVICVAFGGTLLMAFIQALNSYKGSGLMKIVMWILSAASMFTLFTVVAFADLFENFSGLLVSIDGIGFSGYTFVRYFVGFTFESTPADYILNFGGEAAVIATTVSVALSIGILLAIINHIIDIICLTAKTSSGGLKFDVIRYALECVALAMSLILTYGIAGYDAKPGILLYVLVILLVVSIIITLIRHRAYKAESKLKVVEPVKYFDGEDAPAKPASANAQAASAPYSYAVAPTQPQVVVVYPQYGPAPASYAPAPYPAYANPYPPQPYPAPAPYAPQPAPASAPALYTPQPAPAAQPAAKSKKQAPAPAAAPVVAYEGPTDEFIDKLEVSEKVEFAKLFISKEQGKIADIPDYVVGGDNKDFFSQVFIYLSAFRPLMSTGLLDKIYNEV